MATSRECEACVAIRCHTSPQEGEPLRWGKREVLARIEAAKTPQGLHLSEEGLAGVIALLEEEATWERAGGAILAQGARAMPALLSGLREGATEVRRGCVTCWAGCGPTSLPKRWARWFRR